MLDSGCSIPDKEKRQLPLKELPFLPALVLLSLLLNSLFFIRYSTFDIHHFLLTYEPLNPELLNP